MITILVNETEIEIKEKTNVLQLLKQVNTASNGIAIAINNNIVSKNLWATQYFNQNDTILIIKATQGG